ncbi:hypothetical protein QQY79_06740 [Flavobacterium tructae]|uniref:hypothetical protein n=1 Tax=Flavobacterium tructae TaxID=1114873 RepID=UPI002551FE3B|nr:hypothetical protein [Flavobacterium tructae]MDL2142213.1 hypothetical protein [Flavobacterium tructae]
MKKEIRLLLFIMVFLHFNCLAQKINFEAKKLIVINQVDDDAFFINFNKSIKFQFDKNILLAKGSPQETFFNFFKIASSEQLTSFFNDSIPKSYKKSNYIQLMSVYKNKPEKNFYEIDFNIILKDGKNQNSFIKYINHNELFPKPIASIIYLELINDKWIIKDIGDNFELGIFLLSIKGQVLEKIISKKLSDSESKIIEPYFVNDKIDLKKLSTDFFDLKKNNVNSPLVKLLYDNEFSIF